MMASNLRTISLAEFEQADGSDRRRIADDVDDICQSTGFLTLTGHGVSTELIDSLWRCASEFFDLPMSQKLKARPPVGGPYGYFPPVAESLARSLGDVQPADLKETLNIGPLVRPQGVTDATVAEFCYAPNFWPDRPAELQSLIHKYYSAMDSLAGRIMRMFAHALRLPGNFFRRQTRSANQRYASRQLLRC